VKKISFFLRERRKRSPTEPTFPFLQGVGESLRGGGLLKKERSHLYYSSEEGEGRSSLSRERERRVSLGAGGRKKREVLLQGS